MRIIHRRRRRSSKAFSLVEMMVSVAISSMVALVATGLQYYSAKQIKQLYGMTSARSAGVRAVDAIRNRMSNARNGVGVATVTNGGSRIVFRDPNLAANSAFEFRDHDTLANAKALYYEAVAGQEPIAIAVGYPANTSDGTVIIGVTGVTFAPYGVTVAGVLKDILGVLATVTTNCLLPDGKQHQETLQVEIDFRNDY